MNAIASFPTPIRLRSFAAQTPAPAPAPAPAPPAPHADAGIAATAASALGGGLVAATVGLAVTDAALEASIPVMTGVLNHYNALGAIFGGLDFLILSTLGTYGAVAAATALGVAAGAKAVCGSDAKTIGLLDKPAAALREGAVASANAQTYGEAAKAGAKAGWKAGQSFGALAGGIQGAASGYSLGMLAAGIVSSSMAAGYAGAIGGALIGGAALCIGGKYVGGALGAGFGAVAGAINHVGQ